MDPIAGRGEAGGQGLAGTPADGPPDDGSTLRAAPASEILDPLAPPDPGAEPPPAPPTGDPLERICPYLRSAAGTWRAARPDPDHRCATQDPPASLPLLAQERFCLTDSHLRCEWFKMAEGARQRALDQDGIPGERIEGARFRPAVRSVPVVLDGPSASAAAARTRPGIPGAVVLTALAVALVLIGLVGVLALWSGSGGSAPAPTAPLTGASTVPSAFPSAPPSASRAATAPPSRVPPTTSAATPEATPLLVSYEVQRGERMAKIARKFGISRADIIAANDLGDPPRVEVGQVIVLPFPPGSTPPPGTEPVTQAP